MFTVNLWRLGKKNFVIVKCCLIGNFSGTFFQKGRTGITTTEGAHWKSQRSFLKEYIDKVTASSTKGFEDIMMDEVTLNDLFLII